MTFNPQVFLPWLWGAIPALSFIGKLTVPRRHGGRYRGSAEIFADWIRYQLVDLAGRGLPAHATLWIPELFCMSFHTAAKFLAHEVGLEPTAS